MLRNSAVREALETFRPDLIECQDAYNLPWVALGHRKRHPETALVAAYMTDFPTVYVERPFRKVLGKRLRRCRRAHLLLVLRQALSPVRCGIRAEREWRRGKASRERRGPGRHRAAGRRAGRIRPVAARSALAPVAGPDRRAAFADLCRASRCRKEAGRGRGCIPKAARKSWRPSGADRRRSAARADRAARRSADRHARLSQ